MSAVCRVDRDSLQVGRRLGETDDGEPDDGAVRAVDEKPRCRCRIACIGEPQAADPPFGFEGGVVDAKCLLPVRRSAFLDEMGWGIHCEGEVPLHQHQLPVGLETRFIPDASRPGMEWDREHGRDALVEEPLGGVSEEGRRPSLEAE